jgi:hypothetical protein
MTGAGSTDLTRHLAGKDLTALQAIRAKCADCTGNYADGRVSCELPECPLFPFHPYNESKRRSRKGKPRVRELGGFVGGGSVEPILGEGEA